MFAFVRRDECLRVRGFLAILNSAVDTRSSGDVFGASTSFRTPSTADFAQSRGEATCVGTVAGGGNKDRSPTNPAPLRCLGTRACCCLRQRSTGAISTEA